MFCKTCFVKLKEKTPKNGQKARISCETIVSIHLERHNYRQMNHHRLKLICQKAHATHVDADYLSAMSKLNVEHFAYWMLPQCEQQTMMEKEEMCMRVSIDNNFSTK